MQKLVKLQLRSVVCTERDVLYVGLDVGDNMAVQISNIICHIMDLFIYLLSETDSDSRYQKQANPIFRNFKPRCFLLLDPPGRTV